MEVQTLDTVLSDELQLQIAAEEAAIATARARQIDRIRELDRRQTATAHGCGSLAEWVASRIDVAPETSSALVAAAKRLATFPGLSDALAEGDATYDRVVEVARYASAGSELDDLLDSYGHDIAGLRRQAANQRRMSREDKQAVRAEHYLMLQPNLDLTGWRIHGHLGGVAGQVVSDTLSDRADHFPPFPDGTRASLPQRRADALVAICQDPTSEHAAPMVSIFVDATADVATNGETGTTVVGGPQVGPHTLEAIMCDGVIEVTAVAEDGRPLAIGRRSRVIPPRLRRFVLHRDPACLADGCTSLYRLQVHHRVPYSQGGRTDPDNLVTLCWYHHQVVIHGHGFTIDPHSSQGRIRFIPPAAPRAPPPV